MKIIILFISLIISLPAFAQKEAETSNKQLYKINGAQIFVFDPKYDGNIDSFFKEAKAKGINTIFFRVFQNQKDRSHLGQPLKCETGVYFETINACTVNNLLPAVIESAHKYDIKVFAWMATRSLSFLKIDDNMTKSLTPDGIETGYGLNIFNQNIRFKILNLFEDIARQNVDGILIQDDFIFKYTEGADEDAKKLFEKESGLKVAKSTFFGSVKEYNGKKVFSDFKPEFYIWAEWKNKQLMKFFKEIKDAVYAINPNIYFAANIYYETPINEKTGLMWYSQNIASFLDAGIDYLSVMGYAEQIAAEKNITNYEAAQYVGKITKQAISLVDDPKRIIMKLQSRSFKGKGMIKTNDFRQVCRQVQINGQSKSKDSGAGIVILPIYESSDIYICK